jgi:hypothetical protein
LEALEDRTLLSGSLQGVPNWNAEGPGPIVNGPNNSVVIDTVGDIGAVSVGAIENIAVAHNSAGTIVYAGTVNGGVWKTVNPDLRLPGSIAWQALTDQQASLATSSLALDPLDNYAGGRLWVGTGSLSSAGYGGGQAVGLLYTKDGGQTWTHLGQGIGDDVLAITPTSLIDTGTGPGHGGQVVLVAANLKGLLRSTDGGQTFQAVQNAATSTPLMGRASAVIADPNKPNRFYAAIVGNFDGSANAYLGQGIFRSDDYGARWTAINTGLSLPPLPDSFVPTASVKIQLAAGSDHGNSILYAAADTTFLGSTAFTAVYRSADQSTWSKLGDVSADTVDPTGATVRSYVDAGDYRRTGFVVDPTNPNVFYLGAILRADVDPANNTAQWTLVKKDRHNTSASDYTGGTYPHDDSRALAFLDNTTLLESDDGGIYALTNAAQVGPSDTSEKWTDFNGNISDTEFFTVAYDTANGLIFGGAQDNGSPAQLLHDNTAQWAEGFSGTGGGDGGYVAIDNNSSAAHYFMADGPGGFYRNDHRLHLDTAIGEIIAGRFGQGLDAADAQLASQEDFNPFPFVLNANDSSRMLLGSNGVYESAPYQDDLFSLPAGDIITDVTPAGMKGQVTTLAYGTSDNANAAFVGTNAGELFRRTGTGATFSSLTPPWMEKDASARKIIFDPGNSGIAYVLDNYNRIWEMTSSSSGPTWVRLDKPDIGADQLSEFTNDVQTIELYDPTPGSNAGDEVLLAGGLGGVFRLPLASGGCWDRYGAGLPNVEVTDLHYIAPNATNPDFGDLLLVGTLGRGAWALPRASVSLSNQQYVLAVTGDDNGAATDDHFVVAANPSLSGFVQVTDNGQVQYNGPACDISSITIDGKQGNDTIDLEDTFQIPVTVHLGSGNDTVNLSPTAQQADTVSANVTIYGGGGSGKVEVFDQNDFSGETWTVSGSMIQRTNGATVTYHGLSKIVIDGGNKGNTFTIASTETGTTTTIKAGTGNDTVQVGSATSSLDTIQGMLTVSGQGAATTLNINDQASTHTSTWQADGASVARTYQGQGSAVTSTISYSNVGNLALAGGSGSDLLTVSVAGDFTQDWTLSSFAGSSLSVAGNFSGKLLADTLGTPTSPIQQIQVGGSVTSVAVMKVNFLQNFAVTGDMAGILKGFGDQAGTDTIQSITISGTFTPSASIIAPVLDQAAINEYAGLIHETKPSLDMKQLIITGSLEATGIVDAASIDKLSVGQDLAGEVNVTGPLNSLTVGGNLTGTVSATTIGIVVVGGNLTGQVTASQSLGIVIAGGKAVAQAVFLLDPSISGALNVRGHASITIPGSIFVDSSSLTAVTTGGSAQVAAAGINVVGGVQQSGSASLSPSPTTGYAAFSDPIAFLSGPDPSGMTNYSSVSYNTGSHTLQPGIYSQINASGSASLMLSPGMYIIEGGGLTVTGNASISGNGVTIYNTGSNYPNAGGSYGGITLSGDGSFNLTPAATGVGGAYPGVVIYQSRSNTRALALSGNAGAGLTGMVYAPSAAVVIGGNATLNGALVADRLQVSGNGASTQVAVGSTGDNSASPDTLLAGDLEVYVNDPSGYFTPNELARIQDAINTWDNLLAPYNVYITEVSDPSLANVVIDDGATSAAGGAADGILGCYNGANSEITLLQGWNWYDGADPTQIPAGQYDFQTVVTHELGHALGLGGSADPTSPMYEILAAGVVQRTPTVADLNISDPPAGADPERAAPTPVRSGAGDLVGAWNRAQQAGSASGNATLQPSTQSRTGFQIRPTDRQDSAWMIFNGLPAAAAQTAASFLEQGGSGWEAEMPLGGGLQELGSLPWGVQDNASSAPAEWLQVGPTLARPGIGAGAATTGLSLDLAMPARPRPETAAMPTAVEAVSLESWGAQQSVWRQSADGPGKVSVRLQLTDWFFVAFGAAALTSLRRQREEQRVPSFCPTGGCS